MIEVNEIRIQRLRVYVQQRGQAHGILIPRTDLYQGEYVADCDERLAWLTGFTGSAGFALILAEKAALFVDGRYVLQAKQQVPACIEVHHITESPPKDWLSKNTTSGNKLLYDPWLHTFQDVEKWQKICSDLSLKLTETPENPIDVLWQDRPPRPLAPIQIHDLAYAGIERAQKIAKIEEALLAEKVDACVITSPESLCWLLNIRGTDFSHLPAIDAVGIFYKNKKMDFFVDSRKITPEVKQELASYVSFKNIADFGGRLAALGKKKVMVDKAQTPQWVLNQLGTAKITYQSDPCTLPRALKNTTEQEGTRQAHIRDGVALTRFFAWFYDQLRTETPLTELDLVDKLRAFRGENALYKDDSFPAITGFGAHGAIIHYRATKDSNIPIAQDNLLLIDSGAQYLDGTTDVTRTIAVGLPTAEHRDRFTKVLKGHITLASALFPKGTTGSQLDALARFPLWQAGLDYDHGTGHGVGSYLNVHEGPQRISKAGNSIALQPGMIVSNEPGYYKPNDYGIRIENLVMVVKAPPIEGAEREMYTFETLTLVPIDRSLIDEDQLTADEREWLNAYHERVRDLLMPHVDTDTAAWLMEATEEI